MNINFEGITSQKVQDVITNKLKKVSEIIGEPDSVSVYASPACTRTGKTQIQINYQSGKLGIIPTTKKGPIYSAIKDAANCILRQGKAKKSISQNKRRA